MLGCDNLIDAVDHQPLLKVLGDRKLEDIKNPRLFNLKEKTLPFKFKMVHLPGRKNLASDALSHGTPGAEKLLLPDDVHTVSEEHELVNINTRTLRSHILSELRLDTQDVCSSLDSGLTAAAAHALDDMQAVILGTEYVKPLPVIVSCLNCVRSSKMVHLKSKQNTHHCLGSTSISVIICPQLMV